MAASSECEQQPTQDELDLLGYEHRLSRGERIKLSEFAQADRLRHVVFSGQFSVALLEELAGIADSIRLLSRSREGQDFLNHLLPHKRAMLYFTQPSTRTFLSFMAACQILGMTCNEVRDPSTSSETKGETRFDSIRMFSSYFDLIIMRSPIARLVEACAYLMNDLESTGNRSVPIINAGSGADEHPTQALLDIYTLQRSFQFTSPRDSAVYSRFEELKRLSGNPELSKGLDQKTYGFCGDIGRGRTVRSLAMLLSHYDDVKMIFVSPEHPKLVMRDDLRARLREKGVRFCEVHSLEESVDGQPVIEQVDALYMTRVQMEHNSPEDTADFAAMDFDGLRLRADLVRRMKEYAPILHPFPRDQHFGEIPSEIDNDPRVMYFRQARNGMWIRAALLAHIFDVDHKITRYVQQEFGEPHIVA